MALAKDVQDFSINPSYVRCANVNNEIYLLFDINLFFPNLTAGKVKINLKDLENKLTINNKYIKLKDFNIKRCTYSFDMDKWFKDSIKNFSISDTKDYFNKTIKLKQLPSFVLEVNDDAVITKYIELYIKKYIKSNQSFRNKLINKSVSELEKKVKTEIYTYSYEISTSKLKLSLKPLYFNMVNIEARNKKQVIKKTDFDKSVYSLIKYNKS